MATSFDIDDHDHFFTIGHSNRSIETFVSLLLGAEIGVVADVRTVPRSRANPQFNADALPGVLATFDIGYEHIPTLGGFRGKSRTISSELNGYWTHASFRNYADYALTEPFRKGLTHLLALGREQRCAVMCSEAVWWRCHRRIITDYLIARGERVHHIMDAGRLELAHPTPTAVVQDPMTVVYPATARANA